MSQIQRKFEKWKILEKKLRIKASVMIIRKIHNLKKMIVDKRRDDSFFSFVIDFFIDLNFFDSLFVVLINDSFYHSI